MKTRFKYGKNKPGSSNLSEALVSVSLLMVFILVIITGILSYQRLNYITDTVKRGIRPDRKLILVKEINNNLSEAENSVKSFSLTRSEDYIVRFYELTENTGQKFDELRTLVPADDEMAPYMDTLNTLVGDKFTILDRLLSVLDEFRVQQAMQQVEQSIREQELISFPEESAPTSEIMTDTVKTEETGKKGNFFSRLFKRKNKKTAEADEPAATASAAVL